MQRDAILSQVFFARIQAVEALRKLGGGEVVSAELLRQICTELDDASLRYGRASTATIYGAFSALLRIVLSLAEWRQAVLNAVPDGDRFLRSAVERHRLWLKEFGEKDVAKSLVDASASLQSVATIADFESICKTLAGIPLPIGVFSEERPRIPAGPEQVEERPRPTELSVAFVKFQLGGQPAANIHHLVPRELHDMEIEVRVSRWPEGATHLVLTPISAEPKSTYELSEFTFTKPSTEPPYTLIQTGRAALQIAQGLKSRPFEFKYTAAFQPASSEQPVAVVGHRTLLVEGFDIRANSITGYQPVDEKILLIRDLLRREGWANAEELSDILELLTSLGNLAGRAVQDAVFDGAWGEKEFQAQVRKDLRRLPRIGSDLEEHAAAAGGFTDLSLRGITIELKETGTRIKQMEDCRKYVEQAASYAVAKGKRVALLCILDTSAKNSAPWSAADGIDVLMSAPPANVAVITLVIQGNITRPSKLSR